MKPFEVKVHDVFLIRVQDKNFPVQAIAVDFPVDKKMPVLVHCSWFTPEILQNLKAAYRSKIGIHNSITAGQSIKVGKVLGDLASFSYSQSYNKIVFSVDPMARRKRVLAGQKVTPFQEQV